MTIRLETNISLDGVTDAAIIYQSPNGDSGRWVAMVEGRGIVYKTSDDDITTSGMWELQGEVIKDGERLLTAIVPAIVSQSLKG